MAAIPTQVSGSGLSRDTGSCSTPGAVAASYREGPPPDAPLPSEHHLSRKGKGTESPGIGQKVGFCEPPQLVDCC